MAKRALRKDLLMEIRKNKGRFLSIFLIVALGVAFFAGLRVTEYDMRYTADAYADNHHLMDVRIISTMGLTNEDINALSDIEGVGRVEGSKMQYVLTSLNDVDCVLELTENPERINWIQITEGRLPKRMEECLADNTLKDKGLKIGDTITLKSDGETELKDNLRQTAFEIVGFGDAPLYIGMERGSATLGNGQVSGFVIVEPEVFKQEYDTQIYLTATKAKEQIAFTDGYYEAVEQIKSAVEAIEEERCQARYDSVYKDAEAEILEGEAEYEKQKEEAEQELADARTELNDGWIELAEGKLEIEENRTELTDKKTELETTKEELETTKTDLETQLAEILPTRTDLETQLTDLYASKDELMIQREELAAAKAGIEAQYSDALAENLAQVNAGITQIDTGLVEIESGIVQLETALTEVNSGIAQLESGLSAAEDGLIQVADGLVQVEDGFSEIEEAEVDLIEAEQELNDGETEYVEAKAEAETEFADARAELDDAWAELAKIEMPSWYVTDRDDLPGYFEFGANAERIGAIGKVFPAIFFMVAALVALTAVTRMVEEQRTQIGTYKALGYSKLDITFKYLAYALMATLGGGIIGVLIGEKFFPFVIIVCYRIMYKPLLDIVLPYNFGYALMSISIAVFSTAAATLFACWHELAAQPAVLMRPVAPKVGKRVFLERIGILWRHLSFSQKATFRNLFRYKKRLIMTVFGIGCCCGLVVVGFGLKDSIMNIASIQYDNIQLYDAMVSIEEEIEAENMAAVEEMLAEDERLISYAKIMMKSMDAQTEQAIRTVYVVVTEHKDALDTMMVFRNRNTHEMYELNDEGAMISEQLSNALGVTVGDMISIQSGNTIVRVRVSDITENYLQHYVYMTEAVYQEAFGSTPDYNMYWLDLTKQGKAEEEKIGQRLIEMDGVLTINYVSANRESIEQMLNSLYLIVIVLVAAASLLAFVVIYNLNNINISERRRELATLKLLGFYDMEVAMYVYRENIYLTLIGAIVGLGMGKILHGFVINTIEVSQIMFGREITVPSYIICVVLTFVFSIVVNGVMFFQLRKIDMVESLKSVE